tara:strand:- start:98 stop:952 length:855 start_codon:yes stop_codon:yes gene_type:complete
MLFDIKNLDCIYDRARFPVLKVEELKIYGGELTFIIGPSGIGKSTLLETLGMMNNTAEIKDPGFFHFYSSAKSNPIKILKFWSMKEKYLAELRKSYFSFIFQNNNLMQSFDAKENILLTQLIQGADYSKAKIVTDDILENLNLKEVVSNSKRVSDYSGGQKQRIAFARAIVTDFRILFGDEPTGNLDPNNANTLMDILKNKVSKTNKSAVIVSHDINLALKFADRILVINGVVKKQDNEDDIVYGLIDKSSVFEKKNNNFWIHLDENLKSENLKSVLLSKMSIS